MFSPVNEILPQERDAQWTDSSESLNKQHSPVSPDQAVTCLESVNLNSNLAIRSVVRGIIMSCDPIVFQVQ